MNASTAPAIRGDFRVGELLVEAKVLAVADAMEAMLSDRPVPTEPGRRAAVKELARLRGSSYDPAVVDACTRLFSERGFELPA